MMLVTQQRLTPFQQCKMYFALLLLVWLPSWVSATQIATPIEIAVPVTLTGSNSLIGEDNKRGVELALKHFSAKHPDSRIKLKYYDDKGNEDIARSIAKEIANSHALAVLGPNFSYLAQATGGIYAQAGLACLPAGATADSVTWNDTTFATMFTNGDQGVHLARYAFHVLNIRSVAVIASIDSYGETLKAGFMSAAAQEGLNVTLVEWDTKHDLAKQVEPLLAQTFDAYVLLMMDEGAQQIIKMIRKKGIKAAILGSDAIGEESFAARFAHEPEEKAQPGFFTDGLTTVVPVVFDTVNGETMQFVSDFQKSFGRAPGWNAVISYEMSRLVFNTLTDLSQRQGWDSRSLRDKRELLTKTLAEGRYPSEFKRGLLSPLVFNSQRIRMTPIRVVIFEDGRLVSAPIQIVSLPNEKTAYQKVAYSGVYLNSISDINMANRTFQADFYLWMRYARGDRYGTQDPADIIFPSKVEDDTKHQFRADEPVEEIEYGDGAIYKLWKVKGKFGTDFDLYKFPFDHHTLNISFFNRKASLNEVVYAIDHLGLGEGRLGLTDPTAFDGLKQWTGFDTTARRENLVTRSGLGSPLSNDISQRELSGFQVSVEIRRTLLTALAKNLLPFAALSALLYASFFIRGKIIGERVALTIGVAIATTFLLVAMDSQLGQINTILIDYLYLLLLVMCLFNVFAVIVVQHRQVHSEKAAINLDKRFRGAFVACYLVVLVWVVWQVWR